MPYTIASATAEQVVDAVDACVLAGVPADKTLLSTYLDILEGPAENALMMAAELGFLARTTGGKYKPNPPAAQYLVGCSQKKQPVVFRYFLEQYEPFAKYKERLARAASADAAARQVKALFRLAAHRTDIAATLNNFGTYGGALTLEIGGIARPTVDPQFDYLGVVAEVITDRESAKMFVRQRLGEAACNYIDDATVLEHLVTAYQQAAEAAKDSRQPVVNAANAIESFLVQLAAQHNVNLAGATGINSKVDRLVQAGRVSKKHQYLLKYLGHVRNAADHGVDADIGSMWSISESTAREYVYVAISAINGCVAFGCGSFVI
jgi:hypothetical protein